MPPSEARPDRAERRACGTLVPRLKGKHAGGGRRWSKYRMKRPTPPPSCPPITHAPHPHAHAAQSPRCEKMDRSSFSPSLPSAACSAAPTALGGDKPRRSARAYLRTVGAGRITHFLQRPTNASRQKGAWALAAGVCRVRVGGRAQACPTQSRGDKWQRAHRSDRVRPVHGPKRASRSNVRSIRWTPSLSRPSTVLGLALGMVSFGLDAETSRSLDFFAVAKVCMRMNESSICKRARRSNLTGVVECRGACGDAPASGRGWERWGLGVGGRRSSASAGGTNGRCFARACWLGDAY